jgi:hypothetical protein
MARPPRQRAQPFLWRADEGSTTSKTTRETLQQIGVAMFIQEIVIDGFKSYAHRTVVQGYETLIQPSVKGQSSRTHH